jgi:hypothetical protein
MNLPRGGYVGLLDLYPNAAAAYSLRKLRAAYSGSAVRVMRSSDYTEQDIGFTAQGELDTASLLSFVNEDVNVYTSDFSSTENLSEFNGTGAAAQSVGGVDDAYKFTLSGGFAFRNIHEVGKSYEISFDVYVPSGNSAVDGVLFSLFGAQDIIGTNTTDEWVTLTATYSANYTNGNFYATDGGSKTVNGDGDVFYLKNIVVTQTTADGFVTVWYDQTQNDPLNQNNATQTTAANQPKIVSAGSLVTENGKPIIQRVDSASTLKTSFAPNDGAATKTLIFVGNVSPTRGTIIGSSLGSSDYVLFGQDGSGTTIVNNNAILTNEYINGTTWVYTDRNDVYDSLVNQKIVFANVQFAFGTNDMCLGYQADVTANTNMMNYQELIIYSSDELSNRTAIETNINNFYSIYP